MEKSRNPDLNTTDILSDGSSGERIGSSRLFIEGHAFKFISNAVTSACACQSYNPA